jgi:hypothetical protein
LTSTHLLKMNFQFLLQGTPIKEAEAAALLEATKGSTGEMYPIDLEKVIDMKVIDSKKLFALAIEKQIPDLASLAVRVSVAQSEKSVAPKAHGRMSRLKSRSPKKMAYMPDERPESIIESLHQSSSYWAVGAATILLETGNKEWSTLREIAVNTVRTLDLSTKMPKNSVMYKGFSLQNGEWVPVDSNKGVKRKDTFHVCPMYIGLREGLIWCVKKGLVEQKSMLSVSPENENSNRGTMSRIFYKIRATEKADKVVSMWGDLPNYIESFYRIRLTA